MLAIARGAALATLMGAMMQPADAAQPDVRALVEAYNASGQALFRELARKPGNTVLSPYSIGTAMAMVRSGARGETEREMTQALKHALPLPKTDSANAAVLAMLNRYDGASPELPKLITANALMLAQRGDLVSKSYRALVRDKYAAAIHEGVGLDDINRWVRQRTEGKIERILDQLPPDAAAVLLNAIYLKATWASPFAKAATRDDEFKLSGTDKVSVPMMRQQEAFAVVERAGYRAIRLDYTARTLAMIVVLPNEVDGLDAVAQRVDADELTMLRGALTAGPRSLVALALPRFKTAFRTSLVQPFRKAGITLAFSDNADFSGMGGRGSGQEGVKIGDIQHRAIIEVAEQGTEAAAATAVLMVPTRAAPPKKVPRPIPFVVDRPFLFYVVDDASGAVLFQGRVMDPRQP
jgi:serpin B